MSRLAPAVDFLISVGAHEAPHAHGQSLLSHLIGTYELLCAWGCKEEVCLAGLYHSIYSTSIYQNACVGLENRSDIVRVIGQGAEQLAYLFCIAQRPRAILSAVLHSTITSRIDGTRNIISQEVVANLVELECANLLEQKLGMDVIEGFLAHVNSGLLELSSSVVTALKQELR